MFGGIFGVLVNVGGGMGLWGGGGVVYGDDHCCELLR